MIHWEDYEIRNQSHEMVAEGCQYDQMTQQDIIDVLFVEGYFATDIEIFFDNMQGLWRWNCKIQKA